MWEPFMNDTERITRAHHFENQAFLSILTFRNKHLRVGYDKQALLIILTFITIAGDIPFLKVNVSLNDVF